MLFCFAILFAFPAFLSANPVVSVSNGPWSSPATWAGGVVPGVGQQVEIRHEVVVSTRAEVGTSPGALETIDGVYVWRTPAIHVGPEGSLTLLPKARLTCRGDILNEGLVSMREDAEIDFNSTLDAATDPFYWFVIQPKKESDARLTIRGKEGGRATVKSTPQNRAGITATKRILKVDPPKKLHHFARPGGGRIDAEFAHFYGLGSDTFHAWVFSSTSLDRPVRAIDCLIERCGPVVSREYDKSPGRMEFIRSRWLDSVRFKRSIIGMAWMGQLETGSAIGSSCKLISCDIDGLAYLRDANGFSIEDCVFRGGVLGIHNKAPLVSFKRNIMRWLADENDRFTSRFGDTIEDCILIHDYDEHNNPHFWSVKRGSGAALIKGCIFWFSGPNDVTFGPEGDGPAIKHADSGTVEDNRCIIERCLFLPNSKGLGDPRSLTCNIVGGVSPSTNAHVEVRRNTAVSAGPGGVCFGETHTSPKGMIRYVKSNLFVGGNNGVKIHDFGYGEAGVIRAEDADYNASYLLRDGSNYVEGKTGKGYSKLKLEGSQEIGKHDIDDIDPQFVDPARTPLTWSVSIGGDGSMKHMMDSLAPTGSHEMQELLDYLREGFRPRNAELKGAGDPEAGSPDIGAVNLR